MFSLPYAVSVDANRVILTQLIRKNLSQSDRSGKTPENILRLLPEEESFPRCITEYRNARATFGHNGKT